MDPVYRQPLTGFFRPTCPPRRWPGHADPYTPPRGTGSSSSGRASPEVLLETAPVYPVILTAPSAGSDTVYQSSGALGMPFVIRGIIPTSTHISGAASTRVLASLRLTAATTGDAAAFNAGALILTPFGGDADIAIGSNAPVIPLWIPIDTTGSRLIARFANANAVAADLTLTILITPQGDIDLALMPPPAAAAPIAGTGIYAPRGYNAPFLAADGQTLEYRPEGFIPYTGLGESGYG